MQVWTKDVNDLHTQFETLLFFSIPKLRHIHKRLVDGHIDNIVAEISFLFKNNVIVREKMKSTVKVCHISFVIHVYTMFMMHGNVQSLCGYKILLVIIFSLHKGRGIRLYLFFLIVCVTTYQAIGRIMYCSY